MTRRQSKNWCLVEDLQKPIRSAEFNDAAQRRLHFALKLRKRRHRNASEPCFASNSCNRLKSSKPGRFCRRRTQGRLNPSWTGGLVARVFIPRLKRPKETKMETDGSTAWKLSRFFSAFVFPAVSLAVF